MSVLKEIKSKTNLDNDNVFNMHVHELTENVIHERFYEALNMYPFYEDWLANNKEFTYSNTKKTTLLRDLIIDNKWVCFRILPHEEAVKMFNKHLIHLFTIPQRYEFPGGYDDFPEDLLTEHIRNHLLTISLFDKRDELKKKLNEALSTNEEKITSAPFYREIKQAEPTLKNWFAEYMEHMGPGKFTSFQQAKFFKDNDNVQQLNDQEKDRLRLIFNVYEQLKKSSWTLEGMEEEFDYEGEQGIGKIKFGEIEPWNQDVIDSVDEVMQSLKEYYESQGQEVPDYVLENLDGPLKRPPVDQPGAQPTAHIDIKGVDVDATTGPDHFSDKDLAEIQDQKTNGLSGQKFKKDYTKEIHALVEKLQLVFETPEQEKKFTNIVQTVLNDLRDTLELRSYLKELGYAEGTTDSVIKEIRDIIRKRDKGVQDDDTVAAKPTLSQVTKQIKKQASKPKAKATKSTEQLVKDASTTDAAVGQVQPTVAPKKAVLPKLRRSRKQKKALIDDVKLKQSMVMSPIDELKSMDLIEFRRLSPDPVGAATKIKLNY